MSKGVEWAIHTLLNLAMLGDDKPVGSAQLAAGHGLPVAYHNKQLQSLVKAELLTSTPGPRGGFRLARDPDSISLLDVVLAIEGNGTLFRCTEIRQCGKIGELSTGGDGSTACAVKRAMYRGDVAWREALAAQKLSDVQKELDIDDPSVTTTVRRAFGRD
ncbi:Rrf2 family transcriptional regulator [Streptomyces sp. NPDC005181]|uniref:RrF2 family transcriptional regulator n=1 Tax=Streptomyces sp. NPDC005181 TaxID=3156869 RepID=UPI0033A5A718